MSTWRINVLQLWKSNENELNNRDRLRLRKLGKKFWYITTKNRSQQSSKNSSFSPVVNLMFITHMDETESTNFLIKVN